MPAPTATADEEEEERRQRRERRRREKEKEKFKEDIQDPIGDGERGEERKRRREKRKEREEREKSGHQADGEAGEERRRKRENGEGVDEEEGRGRSKRDENQSGISDRGDEDALEERRRKRRERRKLIEEEETREQTQNNSANGEYSNENGVSRIEDETEERKRRKEERRRRKEREEMEKSDRTKDEGEDDEEERRRRKEERRLRRKQGELNENENQNSDSARSRGKSGVHGDSEQKSVKEDKEENRRKKEEESKRRKEEKRREKEKKKEDKSPGRPTTSRQAAADALSAVSNPRATSPLVDVLKTNRPSLSHSKSHDGGQRYGGARKGRFWAPLPIGSPASSLSLVLDERESIQLWLPAKRHSSMTTEYSIPEDIVVERDSKENNFKALTVAAEVDYGSDFEKSDEEAPITTLAAPSLHTPTKSDYDMADIFRAMNEENQQLQVTDEPTYDVSFAAIPVVDVASEAAAADPSAAAPAAEWDFGGGGVNFGDAINRTIASMAMGKAAQRGRELKKIISLESTTFDIFEMPPAEEHQMYIRNISTHVAQKFVQTGEDNLDEEVQTEDVDVEDRWTQHPPEGLVVCGVGSGGTTATTAVLSSVAAATSKFIKDIGHSEEVAGATARIEDVGRNASSTASYDVLTLGKFIDAAGSLVAQLIEEETQIREMGSAMPGGGTLVSQGVFDIQTTPLMAGGRSGVVMAFPAVRPTVMALSFGAPLKSKTSPVRHCGSVCVWNLANFEKPTHILTTAPSLSTQSDTVVTSLCWSPTSCNVIVGGTKDGVVVLWDLREPAELHKQQEYKNESFLVRRPTYTSAATSNHKTSVVSLATISHHSKSNADSDSSFQMVSMETTGKIFLWTALEVSPDPSGSEELLGLRPHGRLKLAKSSEFDFGSLGLEYPLVTSTKEFPGFPGMSSGEPFARETIVNKLLVDSEDNGKFLITTDTGMILQGHRQRGSKPNPPAYTLSSPEFPLAPSVITSISQHPFGLEYLLAGSCDSTVFLFHREFQHPVLTWKSPPSTSTTSDFVVDVHWSPAKPSQFYVFQSPSTILTWDLLSDIAKPSVVNTMGSAASDAEVAEEYRIVSGAVSQPFLNIEEKYSAFMGVSLKMGIVRMFKLPTLEKRKRDDETEKVRHLLQKMI